MSTQSREPSTSQTRVGLADLVLHAARDIAQVDTALDAELMLSTLLGSVYAGTLSDRGPSLDEFVTAFREHLVAAGTPTAVLVTAVLDALTRPQPPAGGTRTAPAGQPGWMASLGTVRCTGGYAYGDRYGDETGYLATFEYAPVPVAAGETWSAGPEHAVIVLVDHTLGLVKDVVVAVPAEPALAGIRSAAADEPEAMTWFAAVDPAAVRAAAVGYLRATDQAAELPAGDGIAANRALTLARLLTLPELPPSPAAAPTGGDRDDLVADFLDSPEAHLSGLASASGARRESVKYCLGLFVTYATSRGSDPLRWSPLAVEAFLLAWVHENALLDADDARVLPKVLAAWITWAGRRIDLPDAALRRTFAQVETTRAEFVRLCATGERQSPAARAMARLIAEGVDLTDTAAVDAWLAGYNAAGSAG